MSTLCQHARRQKLSFGSVEQKADVAVYRKHNRALGLVLDVFRSGS